MAFLRTYGRRVEVTSAVLAPEEITPSAGQGQIELTRVPVAPWP